MKESSVIFLIENDKDYIYLLERAFRKANIRNPLKIARYGNEAILYLRGVGIYADRRNYPLPALIILDLTNPDGGSVALLGWIREQQEFSRVPILTLAGANQDRVIDEASDKRTDTHLVKRDNLAELTGTIQTLELLSDPKELFAPAPGNARIA